MKRKKARNKKGQFVKCEEGTIKTYKKASGAIETYKKIDGKWVYQKKDPNTINLNGPRLKSRKLIYGVGINDVMIPGFIHTRTYRTWSGIIRRTDMRDPKFIAEERNQCYIDCTLDPRWFKLSVFKEWIEQWNDYENKEIDKDILILDNKIYGPETCLMVRPTINTFFKPNIKRDLPRGVTQNTSYDGSRGGKNLYRAQITKIGEKKKNQSRLGMIGLGHFPTIEEASAAYESARKEQIQFLIETETDIRVKNALIKQQG